MTSSVRGSQLARLLGQWHALPGRHRSPDYAALAVRGPRPARRRPAAAGGAPARRAGTRRVARGQPHHGQRRVPDAARDRPPHQPARRRQLDHAAERAPGGQLRPVGGRRRRRRDRPGRGGVLGARRAGRRGPGRRRRPAALPGQRRLPPDRPRRAARGGRGRLHRPRGGHLGRADPDHGRHPAGPRPGAAVVRAGRLAGAGGGAHLSERAGRAVRPPGPDQHARPRHGHRVGRRDAARRAAPDPPAGRVRDPGIPKPHRTPDGRRAARAAGRHGARGRHRADRRRVLRGSAAGRRPDAAAGGGLRPALPGGVDRRDEQGLLGWPADRLGARVRAAGAAAGRHPGRRRHGQPGAGAAGRRAAARAGRRRSWRPGAPSCAAAATRWSPRCASSCRSGASRFRAAA